VIHHSVRTSGARLGRFRADFTSKDAPGDADELTETASAVTGRHLPDEHRDERFECDGNFFYVESETV
jgi:hypothetical protein